MSRVPVQTPLIGELVTDIKESMSGDIQQRLLAAGYTDIRPAHDCVFRFLDREGTRLSDLAQRAAMTPQSLGEHVSELEELGYVKRIPDPADGRAKLICLTARGQELLGFALGAAASLEAEWARAIGKRRLQDARETLQAVRELQQTSKPSGAH